MTAVTEATVRQALQAVQDPDTGQDLVRSGMISGLVVKDGHVMFAIEVDPARGPALEPLRQAAERAVQAIQGVLSVTAVLTAERNPPPPAPRRQRKPAPAPSRPGGRMIDVHGVETIIAVASGKGGVGKSTTAANLALALARDGRQVGLLDADIYGPSLPRLMGLSGKPHSPDGQRLDPMRNHGLKLMSIGFMVDEETPMIWRGPMVQSALTQMLRDVNWGPLDILVVDMPPGTGDAQLTMAQQVPLAGVVIVSTPQDLALIDARKGLNMFRKVDVPVLGIVENMSTFICPNCGHQTDIFGHGGARDEAEKLALPFLGSVPLHLAIRQTSDAGTPILVADPAGPHATAYYDIADAVLAGLTPAQQSLRPTPSIVLE